MEKWLVGCGYSDAEPEPSLVRDKPSGLRQGVLTAPSIINLPSPSSTRERFSCSAQAHGAPAHLTRQDKGGDKV
jgi:hypothetical protein